MICKKCGEGKHGPCKKRNANKQGADCDCQHRVRKIVRKEKVGYAE
jgi:hypothetical protein